MKHTISLPPYAPDLSCISWRNYNVSGEKKQVMSISNWETGSPSFRQACT